MLTTHPNSKPHFSAAWSRTGRKGPYACYYIHCEPGKCFVGGGLWHPEGPAVQKLRESIDERPRRWRRVLNDEAFKRTFLPAAVGKKGNEAALKAFAEKNKENALKTKPKVRWHRFRFLPCRRGVHSLKFFLHTNTF
jgi:uncharacterized protein (TIGR02453 family)